MYKVLCDNALLCDSRIEELALLNPVLNLEENKAGSFSFKITPKHPFYDVIKKRKSIVEVYKNDELIFSGMCIKETVDFYKQKSIYCEGELSFLNDSIQRPARYQNITVRGYLETLIANHNAQVEESKQFTVGIVTVTDPNDSLYRYTNMESTMQCLKSDLVDSLGGFIRTRHENGIKYIDYLADSQNTNSQVIKIGKNLLDFTTNLDSSEIATAIIPLGAKLETSAVEGLETRLTIESVNGGLDYIYSEEAVQNYGWIYKTIEFDDVTTATALKTKGQKYLNETQFENMVIEAKAIDLNLTDAAFERFKLYDKIRVVSAPHGLNKYFRLTKQTLNLNNPENDSITLGKKEILSLSAKNAQISEEIRKAVESIVPASTILNQAVSNATQLITNAMGGYVYKTNNELYIMDTDRPETATKVWRWNINGLGYSSTGINGEYGLAMTMDGKIVADYIASGTLDGNEVNVINVKASSVDAENITGEQITGKKFVSNAKQTQQDQTWYTETTEINGADLRVVKKTNGTSFAVSTTITPLELSTAKINVTKNGYEATSTSSIDGAKITSKASATKYTEIDSDTIKIQSISKGYTQIEGGNVVCNNGTYSNTAINPSEVVLTNTGHIKHSSTAGASTKDVITFDANTLSLNGLSNVFIAPSTGKLGFFGSSTSSSKKTVSKITTTSSATAETCASKINDVIDALKAYNLI